MFVVWQDKLDNYIHLCIVVVEHRHNSFVHSNDMDCDKMNYRLIDD